MFPMNMGIPELLVILAICVLVFGAKRLPEIGSGLARGIRSFKKGMRDEPELTDKPDKEEAPASSAAEGGEKR